MTRDRQNRSTRKARCAGRRRAPPSLQPQSPATPGRPRPSQAGLWRSRRYRAPATGRAGVTDFQSRVNATAQQSQANTTAQQSQANTIVPRDRGGTTAQQNQANTTAQWGRSVRTSLPGSSRQDVSVEPSAVTAAAEPPR